MNDQPTMGERYSRAIESSNLRVNADRRGDIDVMIASGWIGEGMGPMLYRLQVEFDSVRAEVRGPGALNQTERFLILDKLKTLRQARLQLGVFATELAEQKLFTRPALDIMRVTGRVLDVFLDPTCHHCEGRGFNGASHRGEPAIPCKPCRGSGNRRDEIGKDDEERRFAGILLLEMQRVLFEVDRQMRTYLRNNG